MQIILGSQSPRRQELLAGMGVTFTCVNIHADESFPPELQAADIPLYISRAKAKAFRADDKRLNGAVKRDEAFVLITADTIVWAEGQELGKPTDENDAFRMLRLLSGRTHQVYTGVTLTTPDTQRSFVDTTDVTFRELTDDEIWYYIRHYRPLDKAGAYGIQEWIGYVACTELRGSYFNVMGLPTEKLYVALKELNAL